MNYTSIFLYRTCMTYIFPTKYISRIDQPNWNHIFLRYILFIKHFPRKQQLQELTKPYINVSQNWHATFLYCRSTSKKHNKIGLTQFGAKMSKPWIFEAFTTFCGNPFLKTLFENRGINARSTWISTQACTPAADSGP